ncbi:MFS transporter [Francisella tularensis]|uniref:MFS transporter n=1 Tax=Francisella tularensis TaxID=263 RepID=UPI000173E567|nr:MFS transporter [Francisella tularensis]ACD30254.1 major facilitator superfamily [Francisella tularensis subsp. mediasiatica FSC147]MBK2078630.1 MFS transporter [Francisella tularensis subsp. mediasiatica]MBK2102028.1 MFS transporter [Francisella tularensis subsp. mediasiatica]MBK2104148.1 MFS transporter [Francisella tularensis subsp. mediasiatica]MDN9002563.1 MFS transporter [Francisella tularensis subsp. mediasiatica]
MDKSHLPNTKVLVTLSWIICLIATLNYSYDFFIRAASSVMGNNLIIDFGISHTELGMLSSAYFVSYTIMQIPAGVILDKYNRKVVISIATAFCVLGNYLFSATNYYEVAYIGRIFMGIGSAFGFIGAAKMAGMWLPEKLFSTFIGFATVVGILGGLVTDTLLSSLVSDLGWRDGNAVFTYIGVDILLLIVIFIRDNPKHVAKFTHLSEANFKETIVKVLKIFCNLKFWAASIIGAVLFIPINVLGSLWGVGLIQAKFGLPQEIASHLNGALFIGAAVGFTVAAIIASLTNRYHLMLTLSIVSLAMLLAIILYVPMSLSMFTVLYFLLGAAAGPQAVTFGIAKIISPKGTTGSATARVNMINNFVPIILLPLVGYILTHFGTFIANSRTIYTITSYQNALDMVIIFLLVCLPIAMLIPKQIQADLNH